MIKISVVLPTYNGEKYIRESIDSIIKQSYENWELIIVNDCSDDTTPIIINDYKKRDKRISVINNDINRGLPYSLNIGFEKAHGEYLTWTSDDNIYLRDAFYVMANFLNNDMSYSMVCTGMINVNKEMKIIEEHLQYKEENMYAGNCIGASFMYRREVLETIGKYDENLYGAEDWDYWIRILRNDMKIGFLKGVFYLYRLHEKSLTIEKKDMVRKKTNMLYLKYLDSFMESLLNRKKEIMKLYNSLISDNDIEFNVIKDKFKKEMSFLKYNTEIPAGKKLILYGAGEVGTQTFYKVESNVVFFADKNKYGGSLLGRKILSPCEMINVSIANNYHIIICLGYEKQYDALNELTNYGIGPYSFASQISS